MQFNAAYRHRVEEVHADEALRALRRRGELRDRDRGGVPVRGRDSERARDR